MVEFRGSTQEKWPSEIFRFGYGTALDNKGQRRRRRLPFEATLYISALGGACFSQLLP
jgi:hypothetical protein